MMCYLYALGHSWNKAFRIVACLQINYIWEAFYIVASPENPCMADKSKCSFVGSCKDLKTSLYLVLKCYQVTVIN